LELGRNKRAANIALRMISLVVALGAYAASAILTGVERTIDVAKGREAWIDYRNQRLQRHVAGDEGSVIKMVSIAATIAIGIYVVSAIFDATPQPTNTDLSAAFNKTQEHTGSAFKLGAIIPLVIAAVVILAYIMGIGRGR